MGARGEWYLNPFIIAVSSAVALGLMLVPFAVTSTDHAAAFYGSFIAALISAAAGAGGWIFASREQVLREEREKRSNAAEKALFVHGYVMMTRAQLQWTRRAINGMTFVEQGLPKTTDLATLDAKSIRLALPEVTPVDLERLLIAATAFTSDTMLKVTAGLSELKAEHATWRFGGIPDQGHPSRKNVDGAKAMLESRISALDIAINAVQSELAELRGK